MKKRISATVDEGVGEAWRRHCDENCINASKLLGKLISDYLKKKGGLK